MMQCLQGGRLRQMHAQGEGGGGQSPGGLAAGLAAYVVPCLRELSVPAGQQLGLESEHIKLAPRCWLASYRFLASLGFPRVCKTLRLPLQRRGRLAGHQILTLALRRLAGCTRHDCSAEAHGRAGGVICDTMRPPRKP